MNLYWICALHLVAVCGCTTISKSEQNLGYAPAPAYQVMKEEQQRQTERYTKPYPGQLMNTPSYTWTPSSQPSYKAQ